jgi:transcriptional regulator with XRE-family HTH domain
MVDDTVGARISRARRRKGWTQAELGARAGRSASWVAKVERGHLVIDRRSVIDRVAAVLEVEVVEITGQPYRPTSAALDSGHRSVPALQLALQRATLPSLAALSGPTRSVAQVEEAVAAAEIRRQAADFSTVGTVLPPVIEDLVALGRGGDASVDGDRVASLMVRAAHLARVTANMTGHHDLAWIALEREIGAAGSLGAPAEVAAADWDLCGAWLHAGAVTEARAAALTALDRLDPHLGTGAPDVLALWGALHLRAAVAASRLWDAEATWDHLAQARAVAPEEGNAWQTQFCRGNVAVHTVEAAVELGRPVEATEAAEAADVDTVPAGERRAQFWLVRARAWGMNGRPGQALSSLLAAEEVAGPHLTHRPMARALVSDLLGRATRRLDPDLRRLATAMRLT